MGMSADFKETIFEPFTRAESSMTNKIQGTGLGMAITRNLVEAMGGTIDLESELGQGSCFEVLIDLRIAEDRSVSSTAVSYTHLDVYKRQELCHVLEPTILIYISSIDLTMIHQLKKLWKHCTIW